MKAAKAIFIALLIFSFKTIKSQETKDFKIGMSLFQTKEYEKADSLFKDYVIKYPDSKYGYLMLYNINKAIDSSMEKGLAVEWANNYLRFIESDVETNKNQLIGIYSYLAAYYANVRKKYETSRIYIRRALALDPENLTLKNYLDMVSKKIE